MRAVNAFRQTDRQVFRTGSAPCTPHDVLTRRSANAQLRTWLTVRVEFVPNGPWRGVSVISLCRPWWKVVGLRCDVCTYVTFSYASRERAVTCPHATPRRHTCVRTNPEETGAGGGTTNEPDRRETQSASSCAMHGGHKSHVEVPKEAYAWAHHAGPAQTRHALTPPRLRALIWMGLR